MFIRGWECGSVVEGALSMFLPLGSIPRHGWKESLRLPKAGAHQMIALTPWLRAAEHTEGRRGELNCLRTTYSESARLGNSASPATSKEQRSCGDTHRAILLSLSPVGAELEGVKRHG